jgi:hypothetical protein
MRFLVLFAALLPTASISAAPQPLPPEQSVRPFNGPVIEPPASSPASCRDQVRQAQGMQIKGRKLGELPAGDLHLTVVREVDGCPEPTIVRQGYGAVRDRR